MFCNCDTSQLRDIEETIFNKFKNERTSSEFGNERFLDGTLQPFSKFRCGVTSFRVETGRYENVPPDERCFHYSDEAVD